MASSPMALIATIVLGLLIISFMKGFFVFVFTEAEADIDKKLAEADARRRKFRQQIINLTFRSLKTVAMADGTFHESERRCMEACARHLCVKCPNLDELKTIKPATLAKSVIAFEAEKVAHLLTLMTHLSLIDGEEHPEEFACVEKFATAFSVESETLKDLRAGVMKNHQTCEAALKKSDRPELASSGSAVLLCSRDFNDALTQLCHR